MGERVDARALVGAALVFFLGALGLAAAAAVQQGGDASRPRSRPFSAALTAPAAVGAVVELDDAPIHLVLDLLRGLALGARALEDLHGAVAVGPGLAVDVGARVSLEREADARDVELGIGIGAGTPSEEL